MLSAVVDLTELVKIAMQHPARSPLLQQWEAGAFVWVCSLEMIAQFQRVIARPRLRRRVRALVADQIAIALLERAVLVTPAQEFPRCRDAGDNVVIATAVAARAEFIVTGDRDLYDDAQLVRQLREEWNIQVVRTGEFLAALR